MTSTQDAFLVIRQSLTSVSITMLSAESRSRSAAAQIVRMQAGDYELQYQYRNEPRLEFRQRGSETHIGGSTIQVSGARPRTVDGEYWTARETRGTYHVRRVSATIVNTFDEGNALLGGT